MSFDRKPLILFSSWGFCFLILIYYRHVNNFNINKIEKDFIKINKNDDSNGLTIEQVNKKLKKLESLTALEYFENENNDNHKFNNHWNVSEESLSLVEKYRLQELAREEAEKLRAIKANSVDAKILDIKRQMADSAAKSETRGQTDLFGHWKTENEIHLGVWVFDYTKKNNN